jgi:NADH-quinone oxidoreductase subunit A
MRTRFYLFAMLLVIFDVEVVFLLPWAVNYLALGLFGFVEMMVFLGVLLLGYGYLWRNGGLQWD